MQLLLYFEEDRKKNGDELISSLQPTFYFLFFSSSAEILDTCAYVLMFYLAYGINYVHAAQRLNNYGASLKDMINAQDSQRMSHES